MSDDDSMGLTLREIMAEYPGRYSSPESLSHVLRRGLKRSGREGLEQGFERRGDAKLWPIDIVLEILGPPPAQTSNPE